MRPGNSHPANLSIDEVIQNVPHRCPKLAPRTDIRPNVDQLLPALVTIWPISDKVGQQSESANIGHSWASSNQDWSMLVNAGQQLTNLGQFWPNLSQVWPTLAQVDLGQMLVKFGRSLPHFGQHRSVLVELGPVSAPGATLAGIFAATFGYDFGGSPGSPGVTYRGVGRATFPRVSVVPLPYPAADSVRVVVWLRRPEWHRALSDVLPAARSARIGHRRAYIDSDAAAHARGSPCARRASPHRPPRPSRCRAPTERAAATGSS